jgi:hypothetical protein
MKKWLSIKFVVFLFSSVVAINYVHPEELLAQNQTKEPLNESKYSLASKYKLADDKLSLLPEDMPLAIPLCSNSPFRLPQDSNELENSPSCTNLEAIGIIISRTKITEIPITPRFLREMIENATRNSGTIQSMLNKEKESVNISRRVAVLDLVVVNLQTKKKYVVRHVLADTFFRYAINAIVNDTYRRIDTNL